MGKKRKTKYVILGLLSHAPHTGYDIKKYIEHALGHFWNESYGQIYPALKQLAFEGYIRQIDDPNVSVKEKKKYAITDLGEEELDNYLQLPIEEDKMRNELLLKTFFAENVNRKVIISHLEAYKRTKSIQYDELCIYEKVIIKMLPEDPKHKYQLYTLKCSKKIYKAFMDWCDETILDIKLNS